MLIVRLELFMLREMIKLVLIHSLEMMISCWNEKLWDTKASFRSRETSTMATCQVWMDRHSELRHVLILQTAARILTMGLV